ncbi:hypothetical protein AXF42_Ash019603 [Apostasia shenzhenica]|uniref:Uncharacterized protein n=1 Tax=Apostasia shenzhenica TaxID=1088818 RepID=A0A2I0A3H2_9ASPA|nr:hypothetical protein AXF42_Ash019603 [Apostasia shenzhenica]
MVLWEITAATAYFLGLKKTYRIALRLQRRLIRPNHPRIRRFLHRRTCAIFEVVVKVCTICHGYIGVPRQTRAIFDVAVKVHKNIQQRDLEAGKILGNRFLRFLDRMKPSAQICLPPGQLQDNSTPITSHPYNCESSLGARRPNSKISDRGPADNRKLFTSFHMPSVAFPSFTMMKPTKPGFLSHQRHFSFNATGPLTPPLFYKKGPYAGVLRGDIAQWMTLM